MFILSFWFLVFVVAVVASMEMTIPSRLGYAINIFGIFFGKIKKVTLFY
jgi:hypothetical protein